jgi:large subunit ribosomal protein L35
MILTGQASACRRKVRCWPDKMESEMPKLKTKSSVKKRFKVTATGKIMVQAAGKQHGMIKRTKKFIRQARGMMVLSDPDTRIVKKFLPYDR